MDPSEVAMLITGIAAAIGYAIHIESRLSSIETNLKLIMDYFRLEPKRKQPS